MNWIFELTIAILIALSLIAFALTALLRMERFDRRGRSRKAIDSIWIVLQCIGILFLLFLHVVEFGGAIVNSVVVYSDFFFLLLFIIPILYLIVVIFYPKCQWTAHAITYLSFASIVSLLYPHFFALFRYDYDYLEEDFYRIYEDFGIGFFLLPLLLTVGFALINHFVCKRNHRVLSRTASYALLANGVWAEIRSITEIDIIHPAPFVVTLVSFVVFYVVLGWVCPGGKRR